MLNVETEELKSLLKEVLHELLQRKLPHRFQNCNMKLSTQLAIALPMTLLEEFCQRWQIQELAVFGSVLRSDFSSDSDIDFLYTLMPNIFWGLADLIKTEEELAELTKRRVDLVSKKSIQRNHNWLRRKNILSTARKIYTQE